MKSLHNFLGLSSCVTIISYPRREVKTRKKIRKTSLFVDGCKMRQRSGYTTHSTQVTPPGVSDPYENFDEKYWSWMAAVDEPSPLLDSVGHNLICHMSARGPTNLPPALAKDPSGAPEIGTPFSRRAIPELAQQRGMVRAVGVRRLTAFHVPCGVP